MSSTVVWALVSLGAAVGLLMVIVALLVKRSRSSDPPEEMTPDEMISLGVVFFASGVALMISVGPAMIGMTALGAVFMAMGASKKRQDGGVS